MACYVIGDIHGCDIELKHLIDNLPIKAGDQLVFLGDYIDRGPNSAEVVAYLLDLQLALSSQRITFLKGNHEDMLLAFLGLRGQFGNMFLVNGGKATLESYGIAADKPSRSDAAAAIPESHLNFYQTLKAFEIIDGYLCVHAGINPQKPLADQTTEELFWIRHPFIYNSHPLPYTILFGHTPNESVLFDLPFKLGLDTGLVYGNKLSCFEVESKALFQIAKGSKRISHTPVHSKWKIARATG